jgi:hypothetical protein
MAHLAVAAVVVLEENQALLVQLELQTLVVVEAVALVLLILLD